MSEHQAVSVQSLLEEIKVKPELQVAVFGKNFTEAEFKLRFPYGNITGEDLNLIVDALEKPEINAKFTVEGRHFKIGREEAEILSKTKIGKEWDPKDPNLRFRGTTK